MVKSNIWNKVKNVLISIASVLVMLVLLVVIVLFFTWWSNAFERSFLAFGILFIFVSFVILGVIIYNSLSYQDN